MWASEPMYGKPDIIQHGNTLIMSPDVYEEFEKAVQEKTHTDRHASETRRFGGLY
jgi:hypothetical protein